MSEGKIEVGDIIDVLYNNGPNLFGALLLHIPQDSGDCIHFKTKEGDIVWQNPQSSNFEAIVLRRKANE